MRVNPKKMYVVFEPSYNTRKGIFSGEAMTLQQLKNKFKRGLDANAVEGFYSTKKEANAVADKLFNKAQKRR